jgi:hypothetical protein
VTTPNSDTDITVDNFVPDADPTTTTNPLDPDTDDGGAPDGWEDSNHNGAVDPGETEPVATPEDDYTGDTDGDGLTDGEEIEAGTDPNDADSDNDGVIDGDEGFYDGDGDGENDHPGAWNEDTDGDGLINALDPDSDNDGLLDGTEQGITSAGPDTDEGAGNFIPDADPDTVTDPLNRDTDGGSVIDGVEDANHNGRIDAGERDPLDPTDDLRPGLSGGSCDCRAGGPAAHLDSSAFAILAWLGLILVWRRRP